MGVMDIRPARMEDVPEIAVVHVRSWQAAYRGLLPQAYLALRRPVTFWTCMLLALTMFVSDTAGLS